MEEMASMVRPKDEVAKTAEVAKVIDYFKELDPATVKCLAICVVAKSPTSEDPEQHQATHFVIGNKVQMAALIASQYAAVGRTFDAEKEAEEIPPEKKQ